MRFLRLDIKRIFGKKGMVSLCLLAPLVIIMIFATIVAPMIITGRGLNYNIAICNEDSSDSVREFINQLVNSEALSDLVNTFPVSDMEAGYELLKGNSVSVLLHIPADSFKNIQAGLPVQIEIIGTKAHALEISLLRMTLRDALLPVEKAENILQSAVKVMSENMDQTEAETLLTDITNDAIREYMNRRLVIGLERTLTPLSDYLPVEYYLGAVFALFAALSMLPIIGYTAQDASGSMFRRGLVAGQGAARFFFARVVSGMLFILLVILMLVPTSMLLREGELLIGAYKGNVTAMFVAMLLSALCYSSIAACLGAWLPRKNMALWIGFYLVFGMAVMCGALFPEGMLPGWVLNIGRWLPLRACMRLISGTIFSYDAAQHTRDFLLLLGYSTVLLPFGLWGFAKRGGVV